MRSKTSLFNKGVQKQNIKQHGWIGLIYLVGLLFSVPLQMILFASDENQTQYNTIEHLFEVGFPIQLLFVFIVPVMAGIFLFRYLQVTSSADMIHSLPIKREELFGNHLISGIMMLLLPVWITALTAFITVNLYTALDPISSSDIWSWTVVITVMTLFYFSFSVFVGMMTGMSVAQGILSFILLMLPAGVFFLITTNLNYFLYGFSTQYYSSKTIINWSPILMMNELNYRDIPTGQIAIYLLLAVLFSFAALLLYRFRHVEMATQAITFQPLRPIFKYGVTFCAMIVGGAYFEMYGTTGWLIFGYIFGSLIGYLVAEMILQKTWRIFQVKTFIHYTAYAGVIIIAAILINTDALGYETSVPDNEEIDSVYFGHSLYPLTAEEDTGQEIEVFLSDENYIQNVREFHEELVQRQPKEIKRLTSPSKNELVIAYQLKNGSTLVRQYRIPMETVEKELAGIMESESYKRIEYHIEDLDQELDTITITADGLVNKNVSITDKEEIKELQQILKYEISSLKINEMIEEGRNWGHILLEPASSDNLAGNPSFDEPQASIPWKKSFDELESWLDENEYLEQARTLPEEIEKMEILHQPGTRNYTYPDQVFVEQNDMGAKMVVVEDNDMIEEALQHYSEFGTGEYFVQFTTIDGMRVYGVFSDNEVPESILSKLNNN
ncbi:DUF6449 domain-containing protein [Alteribacillus sp. JSM 102045]|uniref:DUF6449 domain-containing protein n=1 Tax=Alteribacillus sp. JSM 102045 TaxID=1562101 RepID=UPI0035C13639